MIKIRLLIIDDSMHFRLLMRKIITKAWPEVEFVEYDPLKKGEPAPDFDWSQYQILLLDYQLGNGQNGLDWLKKFPRNDQFPVTIMITGEGNEQLAVQAMKLGVEDYLSKDKVSKQQLLDLIQDALIARGFQLNTNANHLEKNGIDVSTAIKEGRLINHFQPIVGLSDRAEAELHEVFLRLLDSDEKLILPHDFLPIADSEDLTQYLDRWVVRDSLSHTLRLDKRYQRRVCLFTTLCKESILQKQFFTWFQRLIEQASRYDAGELLCFQVSRDYFDEQADQVANKIKYLYHKYNCCFCLTDCRNDLTTKTALEKAPFTFAKMHQQLLTLAVYGHDTEAAIEELVVMVSNLHKKDLKVIADQVYDANALEIVTRAKVDYVQGLHIAATRERI